MQPTFCDDHDGVFHLVTKLHLDRHELFDNLFPMLGGFHTAKTALKCADKFIRGSGIEDAFVGCRIFSPKSIEIVLSGTHYYRSLNGLLMIAEAIDRLKSEAFWANNIRENYVGAAAKIGNIQDLLCDKKDREDRKNQ